MKQGNNKIKVCFFSPESYSYFWENKISRFGGAEYQMFLLANYLANEPNIAVSFIVGDYEKDTPAFYNQIEIIKGFKLPQTEGVVKKAVKSIRLFFVLFKKKPSVVITTTANAIVGIVAVCKLFIKFKHIHRTAHLMDVDGTWIKQNRLAGKIYNYGLKRANIVLSQNKGHCKLLNDIHKVSAVEFKNGFEIFDREVYPNKKGVLWVGRFQKWKQPFVYVELAKKIPDVAFTMICPYESEDSTEWQRLQAECLKMPNLQLIEKVPFNQIQEHFNTASVFVNTSQSEGFPNTFLQACFASTPIVSLKVNPDNFLTEYNCGISCNNDIKLLVQSVKKVLSNQGLATILGKNGLDYINNNHDITSIGRKLLKLIKEL